MLVIFYLDSIVPNSLNFTLIHFMRWCLLHVPTLIKLLEYIKVFSDPYFIEVKQLCI